MVIIYTQCYIEISLGPIVRNRPSYIERSTQELQQKFVLHKFIMKFRSDLPWKDFVTQNCLFGNLTEIVRILNKNINFKILFIINFFKNDLRVSTLLYLC